MTTVIAPRAAAPHPASDQTTPHEQFSVSVRLDTGYRQLADFGSEQMPLLALDEPLPLGAGTGPNPARLLAASVAGCLGASLLFCLRKARIEVLGLTTRVEGTVVRNPQGRLRIGEFRVTLHPEVAEADRDRVPRCTELFEDFCLVTESVRGGVPVAVEVAVPDAR